MSEVVRKEPGIVFDPVAIRRVQRIGNDLCEATGEVQGEPESGGGPGSGEGRTGERKMSESADASIESKVIETLIETMMLDHTRSGACGRFRLKNTEDLGVE
jgi:hypothetical protein